MAYKFQNELIQQAEQYIAALRQAEIIAAIVPNSLRDYTVKVSIRMAGRSFGNANLYYSSAKDRFSLKTHELKDASIVSDLERCWDRIDSTVSTDDASPANDLPAGHHIYVDGSYIDGNIGYAFVALEEGEVVHEQFAQVQDDWLQDMHQIGGEIKAVLEAIAWCQDCGIKKAAVIYDYSGLERWVTGEWAARKPATQKYVRIASNWPITVTWHKTESHTGDRWNERADELAKQGALQQQSGTSPDKDPIAVVQDKTSEFIDFLAEQNIPASFKGMVNGQFARIDFASIAGHMDIYSTKSRSLDRPYIHGIADPAFVSELERLWRDFLKGDSPVIEPPDPLAEVKYYYRALEPYHDCDFAFGDLDRALQRAYQTLSITYPNGANQDFAVLRDLFMTLQKETK